MLLPGIGRGLIWSVCFGIAAGILFLALSFTGENAFKFLGNPVVSNRPQGLIFFSVGGVIGPLTEEIFFRGIIYGFFRQWGIFTAVVVSTLLFAVNHTIGSGLPFTQVVGGIVFALTYEKEENLMVPVTIHTLGNLAIFSLALVT